MSAGTWLLFLVAAAVGGVARYLLDRAVTARTREGFPWGTTLINISGSFVLGVITGLGLYRAFSNDARLVLGTGFCGSYTTFSTFAFETVRLAGDGRIGPAARNVAWNTARALLAAACGLILAAL